MGWIPAQEREQFARGQTPANDHVYRVKITYKREGESWKAIDFG